MVIKKYNKLTGLLIVALITSALVFTCVNILSRRSRSWKAGGATQPESALAIAHRLEPEVFWWDRQIARPVEMAFAWSE